MDIKIKLAGAALALSIVAGGVFAMVSAASAQEPTPTPAAVDRQAKRQQRIEDFLNRVAHNLGVTLEQLKAAVKEAETGTIDGLLADGTITQQQADKAKEKINNGEGPGLRRSIGRGVKQRRGAIAQRVRRGIVASSATALNMDPKDLAAELRGGKSIAGVASEKGVSLDDVESQITGDAKAKLDQLVADGAITQERADQALGKLTDNLDTILNKVPKAKASATPQSP